MSTMMLVAAAVATAAGIGGLYLSYYARTAAGASIALAICAVYALALLTQSIPRTTRGARRRAPQP